MAYTNFRIFHDNFIDIDGLTDYDVSSEKTAYPVTNVFNAQRRSKVWRSQGYWNITEDNNKIIFRETTGVNLTARVEPWEYTSTTSFMAAVKQALEIAGGSTYTVTQTYGKFTIASNLGGGGGLFQLYPTNGSFTCTLLGYLVDKTGAASYEADNIIIHENEWILWDMAVPANPDAFIMTDQRNGTLKISPTATIKLQANETRNFGTPSFSQTLTYDDNIISYMTNAGIATTSYRYWRIYFEDRQNPNYYLQLGAVFLGNYLNPTLARPQFPLNFNYVDRSETIVSEAGQIYSDIKEQYGVYNVSYKGLNKTDIEAFDLFFEEYGTSKPFFVSMDTGTAYSSNANRRIILCYFDAAPQWELISPNFFEMDLRFREAL